MIRLKALIFEGVESYITSDDEWNYSKIESTKNAADIAALIKYANGYFNDDEALAEAAFIAMTKSNIYDAVKAALGRDPYTYVKTFMSTYNMYHKQTIDASYKKIQANKTQANKKQTATSTTTSTGLSYGNPITDAFKNFIKKWENSKTYPPGGWKPDKQRWFPHKSPEGGNPTIAFGHKLTDREVASGRFKNGLTDEEALRLFEKDLRSAERTAKDLVPNYEKLPISTKQALINACYRGELGTEKSPKTLKLMRAGKWKKASVEYLDHEEYKDGGDNIRSRMQWNSKQFAKTPEGL